MPYATHKMLTRAFSAVFFAYLLGILPMPAHAQDTIPKKENRVLKQVIQAISKDTAWIDRLAVLRRNDKKYQPYAGGIIRHIKIKTIPFGKPLEDTGRQEQSGLIVLANKLHHITRKEVVRKNLFFKENEEINPYLFADNERYLRELTYLRDAGFIILPVQGTDSVDVEVLVKDVFSLGGSLNALGLSVTDLEIREDNYKGYGDAGIIYATYDKNRSNNFTFGGEILKRNIDGLFLDQRVGYRSYYNSIRGPRQENYFYYQLNKPLLNRFMKFTYELNASYHSTSNKYSGDSLYRSDFRYRYFQLEGWLGFNLNGKHFSPADESKRLRFLSGARVIVRKFNQKPELFKDRYNWQFADLSGVLASFTFYRQNFFRTQFVYGFGVPEDIPEGLQLTLTSGFTVKEDVSRPMIGVNFQQYGFLKNEHYIDYTLRMEGNLNDKKAEDVNLLASVRYFDRLKPINAKWSQRFFLSLTAARQVNSRLNEPLFINSEFGMPEYGSDFRGGDARITTSAESVFFSPWWLAGFRFAPLVSFNVTGFSPEGENIKLYSSVSAGIRVRNESLIFGTIEFKGNYFPGGNFYGDKINVDLTTNLAFKYKSQFMRKPDFIQVN